jgi:adenine phosphoribosyltransferase
MVSDLRDSIRSVPDFPKPGIVFRDITTLLKDPGAFRVALDSLAALAGHAPVDSVACIESRGFLFGGALAHRLSAGCVPIRKPGKLPSRTLHEEYALEYGTDALEIHADAVRPGDRVLVHDDLLATGGTALAACRLVERLGGVVTGVIFLVELTFLRGRDRLHAYPVSSVLQYDSE